MTTTRFLQRPDGRIAYEVTGEGPLVVCVPGMGDLRSEYRFLAPQLVDAGYRVASMDLRGHGESDTGFAEHTRPAVGRDLLALIGELAGPSGRAHVIGCSFGGGAAPWAAAEDPDRIASLTLIGPFTREPETAAVTGLVQRIAMRAMLRRPWGPRAWAGWYRKLYPGAQPADLDAHRTALAANLAEPGRLEAVRAMALAGLDEVTAALPRVTAPTLVVMGSADPDFPDPAAEARFVADAVAGRGEVAVVDGAGHYPHAEQPRVTGERIVGFLASATADA